MNILEYENYHESKEHGQANFPFDIYPCTIPLDFKEVPAHWHEETELIYIKKGKGKVSIDFEEYEVTAPEIVFILPGQLHAIFQSEEESMEYENMIFSLEMLLPKKPDSTVTDFIRPLLHKKLFVPSVFTPEYEHYEKLAEPMNHCDEICRTRPEGYEFYVKGQLYLFFYASQRYCRTSDPKKKNMQSLEKMKRIIKYIENNYMNKITIREIADVIGFSESHFMRFFKDTMGTTFVDYLRDYRLTMAARLLTGSDSAILDIAAETGFENLSYFNRMFRKKYKMTPREYKKNAMT